MSSVIVTSGFIGIAGSINLQFYASANTKDLNITVQWAKTLMAIMEQEQTAELTTSTTPSKVGPKSHS